VRILIVTGSFPPLKCGVGDYSMQLALALSNEPGATVAVLTSRAAGLLANPGRVLVLAEIVGWRISEARKAFRLIQEFSPDVVHVQYPTQGYGKGQLPSFIPFLSKLAGAKVVQTWHEPIHWRHTLQLLLRLVVSSEAVVVRSAFRSMLNPLASRILRRKRLHYISGASTLPRSKLSVADSASLRRAYLMGQQRLLVFFGFIYPPKGVHLLFEIGDPQTDHIVIAGEFGATPEYRDRLVALSDGDWTGKVTYTGFLPPEHAAALLSVADAVILPFLQGGGNWNSSIHGAIANSAYVITTTSGPPSYDPVNNVASTRIGDVAAMRHELALCDRRRTVPSKSEFVTWKGIATCHMRIYQDSSESEQ
jgi:glycosyltransferase involved in cell wall biosynthesis